MFKQQNENAHCRTCTCCFERAQHGRHAEPAGDVVIPAAIPTVLSGQLRVGGALMIVGVVVSEMLISSAGIGYLISRYRTILDSPKYSPACCWC
jgi:ABC-type nitrate/sulfonate/bicarbonate transport system permease component